MKVLLKGAFLICLMFGVSYGKEDKNLQTKINPLILSTPHEEVLKDKNITLVLKDKNGTIITKDIKWISSTKSSIKQNNTNTITLKKDGLMKLQAKHNNKLSNQITLNIKWIVNGHELPPMPDEKLNNSTLLGIDINNNGVRDDVERWIYKTYKHPIERGIFMQSAKAYQKIIVEPKKAHETVKYSDKALSCREYMINTIPELKTKYEFLYPTKPLKEIQFNTSERYIAYDRYNREFNGEVLGIPEDLKENCEFDDNGNLR